MVNERNPDPDGMSPTGGKLVILFIFGLSAVMGGYAWWHHYHQGRKCLELWGSEAGALIRYAPVVEAIELADDDGSAVDKLQIGGQTRAFRRLVVISKTPGLVHGRQALIEDASFQWDAPESSDLGEWTYALRFVDEDRQVTIAFDIASGRVHFVEGDRQAVLTEKLRAAYRERIPDWIEGATPSYVQQ